MPAFRFNSPGKVGKHAIKEGTKEVVQRKARVWAGSGLDVKVEPGLWCSLLSLTSPSRPGWSNRVNLSIGLGNCAWNKDCQEAKTGPCAGTFAYFDSLTSSMRLVNITSLITDSCMTMQYTYKLYKKKTQNILLPHIIKCDLCLELDYMVQVTEFWSFSFQVEKTGKSTWIWMNL